MQTVYIGNTLINDVMLGSQRMDDVLTPLSAYSIEYLLVAAGGAGGGSTSNTRNGGAGGAGGLLSGSLSLSPLTNYSIVSTIWTIICVILYIAAVIIFGFILKESQNAGVVSALVSLSPMITMILSYFFLNEEITLTKIIAFCLALASAILVNF